MRFLKKRILNRAVSLKRAPLFCVKSSETGSILFYIFIAIGLLAALTLSLIDSNKDGVVTQNAQRLTQDLYAQSNAIRGVVLECVYTYPDGGGDLDSDGDIDSADNENVPYPLTPTDALNPNGAASDDTVSNLQCPGAPSGSETLYDGIGTVGRFLPEIPNGFTDWTYTNDADGVYLRTIGDANSQAIDITVARLVDRYADCEAEVNYNSCGTTCLTVFLRRASCP